MQIVKIKVLRTKHLSDTIFLHTNLPSPYPPSISERDLVINFSVTSGKGKEYVNKHFPGILVEETEEV